ncbi:hypothetical protein Tco_0685186 [Tanacetum coccineum]
MFHPYPQTYLQISVIETWAHEHEHVKELLNAVNAIKPTVLIESSGKAGWSGGGKALAKQAKAYDLGKIDLYMD